MILNVTHIEGHIEKLSRRIILTFRHPIRRIVDAEFEFLNSGTSKDTWSGSREVLNSLTNMYNWVSLVFVLYGIVH